MSRYAALLMIVLGLFAILVNTTVAAVIVVLGVAMYLFERRLATTASEPAARDG
jgi:hypothetical protein